MLFPTLLTSLTTSFASVYELNVAWRAYPIHVCYAGPEKVESEIWITEILKKEFSREKTNVSFVGFLKCREDEKFPRIEINLVRNLGRPRSARLGENAHLGRDLKSQIFGYYRKELPQTAIQIFIPLYSGFGTFYERSRWLTQIDTLHEIGHALGLRHEHVRPEFMDDRNCKSPHFDVPRMKEQRYHYTRTFMDYDPNSIMNYCHMVIQKLYGPAFRVRTRNSAKETQLDLPDWTWTPASNQYSPPEVPLTFPLIEDSLTGKIENLEDGSSAVTLQAALSQKDRETIRWLYPKR